jgi:hypothetical protein
MKTLLISIMLTMPANAQGIDMLPYYDNAPPKIERVSHAPQKKVKKAKKPKKVARKAAPKQDPDTRVMAAEYRSEGVTKCLSPVRVVGSQDVRPDAAESSAQKAWMEAVRWTHGEAYQDFGNAKDYQKRCSRSSIGEALGQYFTRCEITAAPCRPGMVDGSK